MPVTTATSVMLSWMQPPFSFTVNNNLVRYTRVTGSGRQPLCDEFSDSDSEIDTSRSSDFGNLQEFSLYSVTVTVNFLSAAFGTVPSASADLEFTTDSAGMYVCCILFRIYPILGCSL